MSEPPTLLVARICGPNPDQSPSQAEATAQCSFDEMEPSCYYKGFTDKAEQPDLPELSNIFLDASPLHIDRGSLTQTSPCFVDYLIKDRT
jgi:hypothetical protein